MLLWMRRRKLLRLLLWTSVGAAVLGGAWGCVTLGHIGYIAPAAVDGEGDRRTVIARQCLTPRDLASAHADLRGWMEADPDRTAFNGVDGTLFGLLNARLLRRGTQRVQNVAIGFSTRLIVFPCLELHAVEPPGREDGPR